MNCIVICLDTFRADCIRHLGAHASMQTPTLDAMARDGVWFENAFAEALPTVPARRSLFTGIRGFPLALDYRHHRLIAGRAGDARLAWRTAAPTDAGRAALPRGLCHGPRGRYLPPLQAHDELLRAAS